MKLAFVRREPVWLYALVCMPPIAGVLNLYGGGTPLLKGHAAPIVFTVALCAVAAALWVPFISSRRWSRGGVASLGLVGVAWLSLLALLRMEGNSVDFGVIAPGLLVALVLLKPPSVPQALCAAQVFAGAIVLSTLVSLLLEPVAGLPSGFRDEGGSQRIGALAALGMEWRWSGPFIHSNIAGPLGGAVALIGLMSRRLPRVLLVGGGVLILLLSQSRTGIIALVVTLALWWALSSSVRGGGLRIRYWLGPLAVLMVIVLYIALDDPTLAGRTPAWVDYFNLMLAAPLTGVGNLGVNSYLVENADRVIDFAQPHAHNFLLDLGGRWGVPMFALSAAILVMSVWLGFRATKRGVQLGLVLAVYMIVVGISELPFTWSHASPLMMVFFLAIVLSASADGYPRESTDSVNVSSNTP